MFFFFNLRKQYDGELKFMMLFFRLIDDDDLQWVTLIFDNTHFFKNLMQWISELIYFRCFFNNFNVLILKIKNSK